ncbi:MAG: ferrous iron transport protein B [Armatimonadota bacterium]
MEKATLDKENNTQTKEIVIALAGNPNSGKTTVFNALTGARQHVGNWPGVTVEHKEGIVTRGGVTYKVIDLPGIYSLSARSPEEEIARDFLINNKVDVIVNVIDASNLERNLYLTTQLLELGIGTVCVMNMVDMTEKMGKKIDYDKVRALLGAEVVPAVASKGKGMDELLDKAYEVAQCDYCEPPRTAHHNPELELEMKRLAEKLKLKEHGKIPLRWILLKSLEGDRAAINILRNISEYNGNPEEVIASSKARLEAMLGDDLDIIIADGRYGFVSGLVREVVSKSSEIDRINLTDKIDSIFLNRILGLPIFLGLMLVTFYLTFEVGGYVAGLLEGVLESSAGYLANTLPEGVLSSLIIDGVLAGVGGVLVFLPNIAIIFIIISILEDSGYMARAAFLMDRTMHILGLHGKAFIPLIMGFGCNVPAVMATRTLETREDRIITILINPFMSCTARLPIYILFAGMFFSKNGTWVIFSLYLLGILLAILTAKLLKSFFFKSATSPFVMELPPYRMPTLKGISIHVWERVWSFISRAGTIILAASIVIWAMSTLPWGVEFGSKESLIGVLGSWIAPVFKPLNLDWAAAVALLFGIGAKEIVVSTLKVLYGTQSGAVMAAFTPLTAYTFMVLSLIYIPCMATIATIKKETASWKWTIFSVVYSMVLAYVVAFIVFRVGKLLGF